MTFSYSGFTLSLSLSLSLSLLCQTKRQTKRHDEAFRVFSNISFRMLQKLQFCLMQHKYAPHNGVMESVV